ncbi:MAG: NAD(+) synthase [Cytophagales bacterium]|nr:NAD(+) synthase [Cytophagales bacterium]
MDSKLIIGASTLNQTPLNWENNTQNILESIQQAQQQNIDILCLPELAITGYGCEDLFLSNWLYETAWEELEKIIPHTKDIAVIIGLPILHKQVRYNCACIVQNQEILGFYAKNHLANDGVHYEPRWFSSWGFKKEDTLTINNKSYPFGKGVYDIAGHKIGIEICEDAWREERPADNYQTIDIIFNPSASHFAFDKTKIRQDIVQTSSEKYNCAYIYTNLLGNEAGRMIYDGEILIAKKGEFRLQHKRFSFQNFNLVSYDFYNEQRIEIIDTPKNEEFPKTVGLALFDYLRKSYSKSFVLSLSGGADSSACAVLVAYMVRQGLEGLGIEAFNQKVNHIFSEEEVNTFKSLSLREQEKKVCEKLLITAYQGTKNSTTDTFDSAQGLAESLGATFYHWLVDDEVKGYTSKIESVLETQLSWAKHDIALQNIQARTRAPIIWMLTNIVGGLLITTSNRSEGDVGYATMDGDTSGSIAPISAVEKDFICKWLIWAEKTLDFDGLKYVNSLAPSAELRPQDQKQTDEQDLMPYDILAKIERLGIRDRKAPKEIVKALVASEKIDEEIIKGYVRKFFTLWSRNQWKRERIAPAFHLDDFNVDPKTWCRFPILNGGFKKELDF